MSVCVSVEEDPTRSQALIINKKERRLQSFGAHLSDFFFYIIRLFHLI